MEGLPCFLCLVLFSAVFINVKSQVSGGGDAGSEVPEEEIPDCTCGTTGYREDLYKKRDTDMFDKHPWLVSIHEPDAKKPWATCAGMLIALNWILTSASCVVGQKASDMKFRFVASKRTDQNEDDIGAQEVIPHPDYTQDLPLINDIALIKLAKPVACNKYSLPLCLPDKELGKKWRRMPTAGWDSDKDTINEGECKVSNQDPCQKAHLGDENTICTKDSAKAVCHGGVGGPGFMASDGEKTAHYFAVGVALQEDINNCNEKEGPTPYTSVFHYREWIREHTKK